MRMVPETKVVSLEICLCNHTQRATKPRGKHATQTKQVGSRVLSNLATNIIDVLITINVDLKPEQESRR
jgi:hypothetical protein